MHNVRKFVMSETVIKQFVTKSSRSSMLCTYSCECSPSDQWVAASFENYMSIGKVESPSAMSPVGTKDEAIQLSLTLANWRIVVVVARLVPFGSGEQDLFAHCYAFDNSWFGPEIQRKTDGAIRLKIRNPRDGEFDHSGRINPRIVPTLGIK